MKREIEFASLFFVTGAGDGMMVARDTCFLGAQGYINNICGAQGCMIHQVVA